jgi:type IV secretion system protein TrbI
MKEQISSEDENKPEGSAARLSIRAPRPRATIALNRKAVAATLLLLASLLGFVVLHALAPVELSLQGAAPNFQPASPDETIRNLPNDYSGLRREQPKASSISRAPKLPMPSAARMVPAQSAEEKLREEQRLARLRQAAAAHSADVSFPGIQLPKGQALGGLARSGDESSSLTAGGGANPRDDDNRQDDKLGFLRTTRADDPYLSAPLRSPLSPYQLMAGTLIPGLLLTGINSDLPGQILGQISQNVYNTVNGDHLLLPQGTKIIGEYDSRIAYGQERVLIVWTRVIFPNGKSISLEGMPGMDLSGYAGLFERVNHHYLRLLTGVVFGSILGAGAEAAQGSRGQDPTFGQLAAAGMAQNLNQAGQQITRKNLSLVTKDMSLEPYEL